MARVKECSEELVHIAQSMGGTCTGDFCQAQTLLFHISESKFVVVVVASVWWC